MRWPVYFILAYLIIGLQIGVSPYARVGGAPPNLVLLAAVFIAINAPRDAALLGCFSLGLLQDLLTLNPLGLHGLAYGLMGLVVVRSQNAVYREHPLTHFAFALLGGVLLAGLLWLHAVKAAVDPIPTGIYFGSALYSAALAPIVIGLLQRLKRIFAFQSPRRRLRTRA